MGAYYDRCKQSQQEKEKHTYCRPIRLEGKLLSAPYVTTGILNISDDDDDDDGNGNDCMMMIILIMMMMVMFVVAMIMMAEL